MQPFTAENYKAVSSFLNTEDETAPAEVARAVHALRGGSAILGGVVRSRALNNFVDWHGLWVTETGVIHVEASTSASQWSGHQPIANEAVSIDAWASRRSEIRNVRLSEISEAYPDKERVIVRGRSVGFTDGSNFEIDAQGWNLNFKMADDFWDVLTA